MRVPGVAGGRETDELRHRRVPLRGRPAAGGELPHPWPVQSKAHLTWPSAASRAAHATLLPTRFGQKRGLGVFARRQAWPSARATAALLEQVTPARRGAQAACSTADMVLYEKSSRMGRRRRPGGLKRCTAERGKTGTSLPVPCGGWRAFRTASIVTVEVSTAAGGIHRKEGLSLATGQASRRWDPLH